MLPDKELHTRHISQEPLDVHQPGGTPAPWTQGGALALASAVEVSVPWRGPPGALVRAPGLPRLGLSLGLGLRVLTLGQRRSRQSLQGLPQALQRWHEHLLQARNIGHKRRQGEQQQGGGKQQGGGEQCQRHNPGYGGEHLQQQSRGNICCCGGTMPLECTPLVPPGQAGGTVTPRRAMLSCSASLPSCLASLLTCSMSLSVRAWVPSSHGWRGRWPSAEEGRPSCSHSGRL